MNQFDPPKMNRGHMGCLGVFLGLFMLIGGCFSCDCGPGGWGGGWHHHHRGMKKTAPEQHEEKP